MPRRAHEATQQILASKPDTGIIMLTMLEDNDSLFAAMCAGARGYILKGAGKHINTFWGLDMGAIVPYHLILHIRRHALTAPITITHSFVAKIRVAGASAESGAVVWRGQITHVFGDTIYRSRRAEGFCDPLSGAIGNQADLE